jgi:hypothetical protein
MPSEMTLLEVDQGQPNSWLITPRTRTADIVLAGTEDLAATVHRGANREVVFSPTVTHSGGKALLSVTTAETTALSGLYVVRLLIDDVGYRIGRLKVHATPGDVETRPVYGTLDDARRFASTWIDSLMSEYDELDLNPYFADAREWIEERILERLPTGRRATVQAYLDDDGLIVSQRVREITARVAVAKLCEGQMGGKKEDDDAWRERATWQHNQIAILMQGFSAAIDTDGDGEADYYPGVITPVRLER